MEITTSDATFEQDVIEKSEEIPVIVDFWATWCPPCLILGPILEKIAEQYEGKIILAKLNVDEGKQKAVEYNISAIPAVKLFKDGKVIDEFIGARSEEDVKEFIDRNI